MIYNRGHFQLEKIVDDDGVMQLNRDGSAIATNKKVFACLEGIVTDRKSLPLNDSLINDDIGITQETARNILRLIPRDKLFKGALEHADIKSDVTGDGLIITITDGKRTNHLKAKSIRKKINQKPFLDLIYNVIQNGRTICLNRKRLLQLLDAMEKSVEDSTGESPVWLSFNDNGDIAVRSVSYRTGQKMVGYMHAYQDVPDLPKSNWERQWGRKPLPRKRKI